MGCERSQDTSAVVPASSPDLQRTFFLLGERLGRVGAQMDDHLRPLRESLSEFGRVNAVYEPLVAAMRELVKVWGASLPPPDSLAADLFRVFAHTRTDQERVAAAHRLLKHFGLEPDQHEVGSLFLAAAEIGHYAPWQANEALAFVRRRMWNEIRRSHVTMSRETNLEEYLKKQQKRRVQGRRELSAFEAEFTLAARMKQTGVAGRNAELLWARFHGEAGTEAAARLRLKVPTARVCLHRTRTKIQKIA